MQCVTLFRFLTHCLNVILGCIILGTFGIIGKDLKEGGEDHCILFADLARNDTFGNQAYCNYVLASGAFCLVPSLGFAIVTLVALCSAQPAQPGCFTLIEFAASVAEVVIMLASGAVITSGFKSTCDSFNGACSSIGDFVQAALNTSSSNMYNSLSAAQASAWISCAAWAFFLLVTFCRVRSQRKKAKAKGLSQKEDTEA